MAGLNLLSYSLTHFGKTVDDDKYASISQKMLHKLQGRGCLGVQEEP
jgi:hypothetical protein